MDLHTERGIASTAAASPVERRKLGAALRHHMPRSAHGAWSAPAGRADPVAILVRQGESRIQELRSCAVPPR
jgi:hypothetical protein